MSETAPVVSVVDDDPSVRRAIKRLISSVGLHVQVFPSGQELLKSKNLGEPGCLILDIRLPGISGLDFQKNLAESDIHLPVIFITAHGDITMAVRAMKAGAIEFLTKPFRDQDLLDAIQVALEKDRARRRQKAEITVVLERLESLTTREREVIGMVVKGMLNKEIASKIGVTENTVKVHRSRALQKMQAHSLADLVRMVAKAQS
ncbi:MAG: response regulator [Terriglobales bacterium]|jgi:RNA polymerase sigma factor (sigma-70 family)